MLSSYKIWDDLSSFSNLKIRKPDAGGIPYIVGAIAPANIRILSDQTPAEERIFNLRLLSNDGVTNDTVPDMTALRDTYVRSNHRPLNLYTRIDVHRGHNNRGRILSLNLSRIIHPPIS